MNVEARTIKFADLALVNFDEIYNLDQISRETYAVAAGAVFKLGKWTDVDLGIRTEAEYKNFLENYDGPEDNCLHSPTITASSQSQQMPTH